MPRPAGGRNRKAYLCNPRVIGCFPCKVGRPNPASPALPFGMPSELADFDPQPSPPTSPSLPPLTLTWLDRKALHIGFSADEPQLAALDQAVLQTARALAGPERAEARLAMTAKALAMARAKLLILESLLDARITAADDKGVQRLSRVVEGARRHFEALLAEHRHACEGGRRTPVRVTVGQADAVNVMAVVGGR